MERAQAYPVGSAFLEGDKVAHNVNDVGGVKYLLYCVVVYHLFFIVLLVRKRRRESVPGQQPRCREASVPSRPP